MTINAGAKGVRNELRCEKELRTQGYKDIIRVKRGHRGLKQDFFGLFDVIALTPDHERLLFIQVKSNRCDAETRAKIRLFEMPEDCEKWIWIWKDKKGWDTELYL